MKRIYPRVKRLLDTGNILPERSKQVPGIRKNAAAVSRPLQPGTGADGLRSSLKESDALGDKQEFMKETVEYIVKKRAVGQRKAWHTEIVIVGFGM